MCYSKNVQAINCSNDSDDSCDSYENDTINSNSNTKEWNVKMLVNKIKTIQFKIDTRSMRILEKNIAWYWSEDKQKAIDYLKTILTSKPVLQYYDVNKPCILSAKALRDGLAAVLLQNKIPCAYASKPMRGTQKRYAQIEKEVLAILFAFNKTKNRARQCFSLTRMARDIEKMDLSCLICMTHRENNPQQPLISYDIPNRP
ncbi:hypothetical protein ILUMI_05487 [Ignelater luminosus]|uniref:Reverse transcriptase/retrotransposon-derived protein RNase H-like domain-containing protein n=1 Tax=Ignelater luminosus TaxID=2038154 RepID=A0A8K0DHK9_IGNLU|nr:hypothetical protein ILUMI_05487 [Ignelater luminosus]